MKILDINNNEILEPNLELGYLQDEQLFVKHHEAIAAVEEIGHYETIVEYPNGGKDVAWIVDIPATEAKEAWDEYEDIQRYVEYTQQELYQIEETKNLPQDVNDILLGLTSDLIEQVCKMEMKVEEESMDVYNLCLLLLNKGRTGDLQRKLDVYLAADRLTVEQYSELVEKLNRKLEPVDGLSI